MIKQLNVLKVQISKFENTSIKYDRLIINLHALKKLELNQFNLNYRKSSIQLIIVMTYNL